jgi:hypothetical protein
VDENGQLSLLGQVFAGDFAVNQYVAVAEFHLLARQTNDALHDDLAGVSRASQGDHFPTPGRTERKCRLVEQQSISADLGQRIQVVVRISAVGTYSPRPHGSLRAAGKPKSAIGTNDIAVIAQERRAIEGPTTRQGTIRPPTSHRSMMQAAKRTYTPDSTANRGQERLAAGLFFILGLAGGHQHQFGPKPAAVQEPVADQSERGLPPTLSTMSEPLARSKTDTPMQEPRIAVSRWGAAASTAAPIPTAMSSAGAVAVKIAI